MVISPINENDILPRSFSSDNLIYTSSTTTMNRLPTPSPLVHRHSIPPPAPPSSSPRKHHSPPPPIRESLKAQSRTIDLDHPSIKQISMIEKPHSPLPTHPARPSSPSTLEIEDDGYGLNGIGYKPTPQVAYARAQKRKQQVMDWRLREAREARQRRSDRRTLGNTGVARRNSSELVRNAGQGLEQRRVVRFALT